VFVRLRGLGFRPRDASQILPTDLTRIDVCWSATFSIGFADNVVSSVFQANNLVLALRSGERYRIARALASEATYASRGGGRTARRTQALLLQAHRLAAESGEPHAVAWAHCASGIADYLAGRYKRALENMDRATAIFAEVLGAVWELDTMGYFSSMCRVHLGQIRRVARETPNAVRDARQRGDIYAAVNLRVGYSNLAWLAADDAAGALTQLDEAMSEWSKRGFHLEHFYELLARTNALLYSGRALEAQSNLTARWPALRRSLLPLAVQAVLIHALEARGRCAIAAAEEGAAHRPRFLRDALDSAGRIERERMDWATPKAKLLRAGIAMARDDRERAAALLRDAASGFDAVDMALYAAAARRTLGKLIAGDEGRALAEQAEAWMQSETVKNPARMTAMLVPGFEKLG
jgi:hypothetical protein